MVRCGEVSGKATSAQLPPGCVPAGRLTVLEKDRSLPVTLFRTIAKNNVKYDVFGIHLKKPHSRGCHFDVFFRQGPYICMQRAVRMYKKLVLCT